METGWGKLRPRAREGGGIEPWPWPGAKAGSAFSFLLTQVSEPPCRTGEGHSTTLEGGFSSPCDSRPGSDPATRAAEPTEESLGKVGLGHASRRRGLLQAEARQVQESPALNDSFLTEGKSQAKSHHREEELRKSKVRIV